MREKNIVAVKLSPQRIVLLLLLFLILTGQIYGALYLKRVADYKRAVKETTFSGINISGIPDGVYQGEYDVNFISVRVEVTVRNKAITHIDILEHKNGRGKPAEVVADRIVEEQKIEVDAVSGATNSSIVIQKAVENALKGQ